MAGSFWHFHFFSLFVCYINTCQLAVSSTPQNSSSPIFVSTFREKKEGSEFHFLLWVWVFFLNWVSGFSEMEVSLVRSSRVKIGRADLGHRELGYCKLSGNSKTNISFGQSSSWKNGRLQFTLRAVQSESVRPVIASGPSKRSKPVRLLLLLYLRLVCQKLNDL